MNEHDVMTVVIAFLFGASSGLLIAFLLIHHAEPPQEGGE